MYYFFRSIKDTFIDESLPDSNFGRDEILEVGRTVTSSSGSRIRSLIDFDISAVSGTVVNGIVPETASFDLLMYEAVSTSSIMDNFWFDTFLLTTIWNEGTGSRANDYKNGYCSWNSASDSTAWTATGSDYNTSYSASMQYITGSGDLLQDVTTLISGSIISAWANKGLMTKVRSETTSASLNPKKFFGNDTHTIYEPVLIAKWDDSITTGSLPGQSTHKNYVMALVAPKETYGTKEKTYFELYVRETYPTLSWGTSSADIRSGVLDNMRYQFEDIITGDIIIPFSSQSKVSWDATTDKNYFYFYMQTLQPYRTYDLKIEHTFSGSEDIYNVHQFRTIE